MTLSSHILEVKFSQLLRVIQNYNSYTRIFQRERNVSTGYFKINMEKLLDVLAEE